MQVEEWQRDDQTQDDDRDDVITSDLPEDLADHFGIQLSLLILCVAFFLAAMWMISGPSFDKCSALENVTQRNACYGELRIELLKPPAKGGVMPAS